MTLELYDVQKLFGTHIVELSGKMDLKQLSVRQKNMLIRYLQNGYIASSRRHNVGFIADKMLRSAGVFYMYGKMRGHMYVGWDNHLTPPDGIETKLIELFTADDVATQIRGGIVNDRGIKNGKLPFALWEGHATYRLRTLPPAKHVPKYLDEYTKSLDYAMAIAPWIDFVKTGNTIHIDVVQRKLTR